MRALPKVMAGVVTLAMSGGLLLGAAGIANAAYNPSSPPYPVDPNNSGTVTIYDAVTGAIVTSGSSTTPLSSYYFVANTDFSPGKTKATLAGFLAEAGKAPGAFSGQSLAAATTYPVTAAPAPVNGKTTPVAKGGSTSSFSTMTTNYPNTAASGSDFYNLYQLRVTTTFPAPASQTYDYVDVQIDPTTNTWTQVSPNPAAAPVAPGKPTATAGNASASVTVAAVAGATSYTVTSSPGGFVQTGAGPTFSFTGLTNGTPYTFTATATNSGGTSPASPASDPVTPFAPAPASNTALSVTGGPYTDTPYTFTATVSSTGAASQVNAGSVSFFDNGSSTALGTVAGTSGGSYVLSNQSLTAGNHSIVASFTPTDPTAIAPSQSAAQAFTTQAPLTGACAQSGSVCTDPQGIQVDVPVGTLIINTPYTSSNPLILPAMTLNATASPGVPVGTQFSSSAAFSNIIVTDNRSGGLPWTAKAQSSNLTNGTAAANGVINSQNVGLTGVTGAQSAGSPGTVAYTQNAAASPAVAPNAVGTQGLGQSDHTFATNTNGSGTTTMNGTLTINAPTSTAPGTYNGTVTFTVG